MPHVLNGVCTIYTHRNSMFGDERFKRYGCSEPGKFSDLVYREACQCANRILFQERNGSTTRL